MKSRISPGLNEWNISETLNSYSSAQEICWVQEEPQNMGAWSFLSRHFEHVVSFGRELRYVGRPERASAAPGSRKAFKKEQDTLIAAAFE